MCNYMYSWVIVFVPYARKNIVECCGRRYMMSDKMWINS